MTDTCGMAQTMSTLADVDTASSLAQLFLPTPPAQQPTNFRWGPIEGAEFSNLINNAYEEVIHWRQNLFLIPSGSVGKAFVSEITRHFQACGELLPSICSIESHNCPTSSVVAKAKPIQ